MNAFTIIKLSQEDKIVKQKGDPNQSIGTNALFGPPFGPQEARMVFLRIFGPTERGLDTLQIARFSTISR